MKTLIGGAVAAVLDLSVFLFGLRNSCRFWLAYFLHAASWAAVWRFIWDLMS